MNFDVEDEKGRLVPMRIPVFKNSVFEVLLNWLDGQILVLAPFLVSNYVPGKRGGVQRTFRYTQESLRAEDEMAEDHGRVSKEEKARRKEGQTAYAKEFEKVHLRLKEKIYAQRGFLKDKIKSFSFPQFKVIAYDLNSVEALTGKLRAAVNILNCQGVEIKERTEVEIPGVNHNCSWIMEPEKILKNVQVFNPGDIRQIPYSEIYVIVPDGAYEVYGPDELGSDGWQRGPLVGGIKPLLQELAAMKREGLIQPDISIRRVLSSHALGSWLAYKRGLDKQLREQEKTEIVYATGELTRAKQGWQSVPCRHCSSITLDDVMNFSIEMENEKIGEAGECVVCKAERAKAYREYKNKYASPHYAKSQIVFNPKRKKEEKVSLEDADRTFLVCSACSSKIEVSKKDELRSTDENKKPICATCSATSDWEEGFYSWGDTPTVMQRFPSRKPSLKIQPGADDFREAAATSNDPTIVFLLNEIERLKAKLKKKEDASKIAKAPGKEVWSVEENKEGEEVVVVTPSNRFEPLPPAINEKAQSIRQMIKECLVELGVTEKRSNNVSKLSPEFARILEEQRDLDIQRRIESSFINPSKVRVEERKPRPEGEPAWDREVAPTLYNDPDGYEYFYTKDPVKKVIPDGMGGAVIKEVYVGLHRKYTGRRHWFRFAGNVRYGKPTSNAPQASVAAAHATNEARIERVRVFAHDHSPSIVRGGLEASNELGKERAWLQEEPEPTVEEIRLNKESIPRNALTFCSECYEDFTTDEEFVESGSGAAYHPPCWIVFSKRVGLVDDEEEPIAPLTTKFTGLSLPERIKVAEGKEE